MIFNNGAHAAISDRTIRADKTIVLQHGEKMLFGEDKQRGLVLDGFKLRAVTIGEDGYTCLLYTSTRDLLERKAQSLIKVIA